MSLSEHIKNNAILGGLSAPGGALTAQTQAALAAGGVQQSAVQALCYTAQDIINAFSVSSTLGTSVVAVLWPMGTTINVPTGTTITMDSAIHQIDLNYGVLSCAGWGTTTGTMLQINGNNSGVHDYTKYTRHKVVLKNGMLLGDYAKYVGADNGPDLVVLDTPGMSGQANGNRVFFERVLFVGGRRNVIFGSNSYFAKFIGCELTRALQCFGTLATGVHDFAEQIELTDGTLISENGTIWGPAAYGQAYTMTGGSVDYNLNMFSGANAGTKVTFCNTHIEYNYGEATGQTNEPWSMSSAGGSIDGVINLFYTGASDPKYPSHFVTQSSTNKIDLKIKKAYRLGRTSRTGYDVLHRNKGAVNSPVSIRLQSEMMNPIDFPAMITVAESQGSFGMIRAGLSDPNNGLGHIIGKSGTAVAYVSRSATTNGVTQPTLQMDGLSTAQPMLELANSAPGTAAKYYFAFPKYERGSKEAWAMFFNTTAITSGSVVVREWRNGPAASFDGTSVTFALTKDGANYHPATVTLSAATAPTWTRYDWRDMCVSGGPSAGASGNGTCDVQVRHDMTMLDIVEIDVTNLTGFLYIGLIGCGPMGIAR